jgi:hypothetical protein
MAWKKIGLPDDANTDVPVRREVRRDLGLKLTFLKETWLG